MRFKWLNVILLGFVVAAGAYIVKKESEAIQMPFRCQGLTEYNLGEDGHEVKLSINQDLRLEANARSIFLIRGNASDGNEKYNLNRVFELSGLQAIDKDTVILKIDRIVKSKSDNTPDALFNIYLDELVFEPRTLQLDIVYLDKKAWLISNPMQFFYSCARY